MFQPLQINIQIAALMVTAVTVTVLLPAVQSEILWHATLFRTAS
jgi:hypothetical protein